MARLAMVEKNIATLRTKLQPAKMKYFTEGEISGWDFHDVKVELGPDRLMRAGIEKLLDFLPELFGGPDDSSNRPLIGLGVGKDELQGMSGEGGSGVSGLFFVGRENRVHRIEKMSPFRPNRPVARSARGIKNKDSAGALSLLVAGGGLEPPTSGL